MQELHLPFWEGRMVAGDKSGKCGVRGLSLLAMHMASSGKRPVAQGGWDPQGSRGHYPGRG